MNESPLNEIESRLRALYRSDLGREADEGGLRYWAREMGQEIDPAERVRFLEAAQPEVQRRLAAGETTIPGVALVAPEARRALQSQDLTADEYKTLSNYFGNQWIAGEAGSSASLTRRDYIERPRSGYDFATFLATRSPQHGAPGDNTQRLANLISPYMGRVGSTAAASDEGTSRYVVNPFTGQTELANPLGVDDLYRIYRPPHHGSIGDTGNRYAVGLDYRIDPTSGEAEFVAPYAAPYTDTGHRDWQGPLSLLATGAGMYFFPGMDLGSMLTRGALSLGSKAVTRG